MKFKTAKRIAKIWDRFDSDDRSTEMLMALTSEKASAEFGREIDNADVAEALLTVQTKREQSCPNSATKN